MVILLIDNLQESCPSFNIFTVSDVIQSSIKNNVPVANEALFVAAYVCN